MQFSINIFLKYEMPNNYIKFVLNMLLMLWMSFVYGLHIKWTNEILTIVIIIIESKIIFKIIKHIYFLRNVYKFVNLLQELFELICLKILVNSLNIYLF